MAMDRGLVTPDHVQECEEFVQDNLFQGSVILALFHRGYLQSEEVKKLIDLCMPESRGEQPTLELAAKSTGGAKKKATARTILISKETIEKLAQQERERRLTETDANAAVPSPKQDDRVIRYHEVIGPYHIVEMLGRGGMGRVVKAYHRDLARMVALKFILAEGEEKPQVLRRFEQEAMLAAKLHHPHIVAIYDVDFKSDRPYIAMEYVPGQRLSDLIAQRQLTVQDTLQLGVKLARALHYAHERGIIHRDVKPQNILLDAEGEPRLADFGLAKSLASPGFSGARERVMGTIYYMSPEQIRGQTAEIGPQSDVFSLGSVLFEMLSGELPFDAEEELQVLKQILHDDPVVSLRGKNPAVDADLEAIVLKALEKSPQRRYRSAKALSDDLENYVKGRPILARPYSGAQLFRRWVSRHKLFVGLISGVLALGGASLAYAYSLGLEGAGEGGGRLTVSQFRDRSVQALMRQAAEQRLVGNAAWERMVAAEKSGQAVVGRLHQRRASASYDQVDQLYARAFDANPSLQQPLLTRIGLLHKRLRWAMRSGALSDELRLAALLGRIGKAAGQQQISEDRGRLTLRSEPSGLRFSLYRLQPEAGRLIKAGAPLAHGTTPKEAISLPAGRYLVLLTDSERGVLRESVLVRGDEQQTLTLTMIDAERVPSHLTYVSGGPTIVGGDDAALHPRPRRWIQLKGFCISRFEVTVREYLQYLNTQPDPQARLRRRPRSPLRGEPLWKLDAAGLVVLPAGQNPDRPVTGISWQDAVAFTRWLGEHKYRGRSYRLPTADEWERAARSADGRAYPWGNQFNERYCITRELDSAEALLTVGRLAKDQSVCGAQDMAGSVREWVSDWFSEPLGQRMVRGGSYLTDRRAARAASVSGLLQGSVAPDLGFRVARDP